MDNEIDKVRGTLNKAIDSMNFGLAIKLTKLLQELLRATALLEQTGGVRKQSEYPSMVTEFKDRLLDPEALKGIRPDGQ